MFDKNGNATETGVITVYGFEPTTGEFLSSYDVRILAGTGIPVFSTLTPPPDKKEGAARIYRAPSWLYIEDFRGITAYSTLTGEPQIITYLGKIRDGYITIPPSSRFDSWNGKRWVTDIAARQADEIRQTETRRETLLAQADDVMRDWRDELTLGTISEEDKAKLAKWLEYKKQLKALDASVAPPTIWPELPGL